MAKTTPNMLKPSKHVLRMCQKNPKSKLAQKHLKYLRFFTVFVIVVADASGQAYVDNVQVTRIK